MRIDAAKHNIDAQVWVHKGSPRVRIRIGWQRYSATPDEAIEFARQLIAAAEGVRSADDH